MTRSARCGLCGEALIYNPESFAWRHERRADDDHAPVPTDVVYPSKSAIKKGPKHHG